MRGVPILVTILYVAFVVTPWAAVRLLKPSAHDHGEEDLITRLYRRVMQAARTGDTMATRLAPMALGAYEMLDSVDADDLMLGLA